MDKHDTIGFDLVGMVVDDLVVCGAEPLFLTDYIACGRVVPERIAAIVKGIAEACVEAGCALIGGETAEHPGLLGARRVRRRRRDHRRGRGRRAARPRPGPARRRGDRDGGLAACTPTATPWSATCCSTRAGWTLDRHVDELGRTLGEELLEPTRIYAKACLDLAAQTETHAMSHVTGGGLAANLERVLPERAHRHASTGRPGPRSRSSTWCARWATSPRPTSRRPSTAASAWSP